MKSPLVLLALLSFGAWSPSTATAAPALPPPSPVLAPHGNSYRPPPPPPPPRLSDRTPRRKTPGASGPATGGGARAGSGGSPGGNNPGSLPPPAPVTPRRPWHNPFEPDTAIGGGPPDPTRWETWWNYNHDPYLDPRHRLEAMEASSGSTSRESARAQLRSTLWPHLTHFFNEGGPSAVVAQVMVATGRIGDDPQLARSIMFDSRAPSFLRSDQPELRETALRTLGILGGPTALPVLESFLLDGPTARAFLGEMSVGARERAVAAYGLGLVGERSPSNRERRRIVHALLTTLGSEEAIAREIQVACLLALGRLPIEACDNLEQSQSEAQLMGDGNHLCGGEVLGYLQQLIARDDLDDWVRGHAAVAFGRLGASAGDGFAGHEDHPPALSRAQIADVLLRVLDDAKGQEASQRGAVIGLGLVGQGADPDTARAVGKALVEAIKRKDPMSQRLALVALGEVLGELEDEELVGLFRGYLLRELSRGTGARRPWAALALAVAGNRAMADGRSFSSEVAGAVRISLAGSRRPEDAGAYSLALAVLRDEDPQTHAALRKKYERAQDDKLRTRTALALGMLGGHEAKASFTKMFAEGKGPLEEVVPAAVGLRLLGDPEVIGPLVVRMKASEVTAERVAIAQALVLLDALEASTALIEILRDEEDGLAIRSVAAWALGVLADDDTPDWSSTYANDLNYLYPTWTLRSPTGDGMGLLDWR